jgi:hypothetical protein
MFHLYFFTGKKAPFSQRVPSAARENKPPGGQTALRAWDSMRVRAPEQRGRLGQTRGRLWKLGADCGNQGQLGAARREKSQDREPVFLARARTRGKGAFDPAGVSPLALTPSPLPLASSLMSRGALEQMAVEPARGAQMISEGARSKKGPAPGAQGAQRRRLDALTWKTP